MNRRAFIRSAVGGVAGVLGLGAVVKAAAPKVRSAGISTTLGHARTLNPESAKFWYDAARRPIESTIEKPEPWRLEAVSPWGAEKLCACWRNGDFTMREWVLNTPETLNELIRIALNHGGWVDITLIDQLPSRGWPRIPAGRQEDRIL